MLWDIGLLITISICAGFAVEGIGRRHRHALLPVPLLAIAVIAWSAGELLLRSAGDPVEALWARRVLYAGLCAMGPLWLWTALRVQLDRPAPLAQRLLVASVGIEALVYASLYLEPAWLAVGAAGHPDRGPLFAVHALTQWSVIVTALWLVTRTALRLGGAGRTAGAMLALGVVAPLAANGIYIGFGVPANDPTPIFAGLSALAIRWALLDLVGAPYLEVHARSALLEQMDGGLLVADRSGTVIDANPAALALLDGRDPRGEALHSVVAPFDRDPGVDVRRFPIHRHQIIVGAGVLLADRRSLRALEQRAEATSRLEALGVLSTGLAHEINNPLSIVLGSSAAIADELDAEPIDAEETRRWLAEIDHASERIADVVRRMSQSSRFQDEADAEPRCDGLAVFRRAISLSRFGKEPGEVQLESIGGPHAVAARGTDLMQILLSLVLASCRAAGSLDPVEATIESDPDQCIFHVLDRRTDLPAEPDDLFDPVRAQPHGMGLSLAWELARQNGGQLSVRERPGGGAEFRLVLPTA